MAERAYLGEAAQGHVQPADAIEIPRQTRRSQVPPQEAPPACAPPCYAWASFCHACASFCHACAPVYHAWHQYDVPVRSSVMPGKPPHVPMRQSVMPVPVMPGISLTCLGVSLSCLGSCLTCPCVSRSCLYVMPGHQSDVPVWQSVMHVYQSVMPVCQSVMRVPHSDGWGALPAVSKPRLLLTHNPARASQRSCSTLLAGCKSQSRTERIMRVPTHDLTGLTTHSPTTSHT